MGICKLALGNQEQLNDKQVVQVVSVQFVSHLNKSAADAGAAQMATPARVPVPAAAPTDAPVAAGSAKTFAWGWPKACKEKVKGTEVLLRRHAATRSPALSPFCAACRSRCPCPMSRSEKHLEPHGRPWVGIGEPFATKLAAPDAGMTTGRLDSSQASVLVPL